MDSFPLRGSRQTLQKWKQSWLRNLQRTRESCNSFWSFPTTTSHLISSCLHLFWPGYSRDSSPLLGTQNPSKHSIAWNACFVLKLYWLILTAVYPLLWKLRHQMWTCGQTFCRRTLLKLPWGLVHFSHKSSTWWSSVIPSGIKSSHQDYHWDLAPLPGGCKC